MCIFDLYFSINKQCWAFFFSWVYKPSGYPLWRNDCLGLLPSFWLGCLFFLILSCMSCLYILEINSLSVASFAILFSHFEYCLFISIMVSFGMQKPLSLIRFHLLIFVFISIILGGGSKRVLLWFMSKSALRMFFSKSFIFSDLTFKSSSFSLFWVYFMYGVHQEVV